MRTRLDAATAAVILLSGIALLHAFIGLGTSMPIQFSASGTGTRSVPLSESEALAVESCREHVAIIHDVHWAAACMTNAEDDSPECTLPDERAGALNAARSIAEDRCIGEAVAAARLAGAR